MCSSDLAWALTGVPPQWGLDAEPVVHEAEPTPWVRERYAEARAHWLVRANGPSVT